MLIKIYKSLRLRSLNLRLQHNILNVLSENLFNLEENNFFFKFCLKFLIMEFFALSQKPQNNNDINK